jgi:multidrug efflux pump subunit AcrB
MNSLNTSTKNINNNNNNTKHSSSNGGFNLSTWSIRNPIPAIMLFVLLTLAGIMSFVSMKVQNFPDLDVPMISVLASLPGASPEQLETEVARKIENSLANIQGIKHIYTKVQTGAVIITAEFALEKLSQEALDEVRTAISRVRSDLPTDLREPLINKLDFSGSPILAYAISSPTMDDESLSWFVDNTVGKKLLSVKGVGSVTRVGGVNREITITIAPEKIQALGATIAEINRSLKQNQTETPAGRSSLNNQEQTIRTLGLVETAKELENLPIALNNGRTVLLKQLATIRDTVSEPRSAALLNGKPVVGFEIVRSKGAGELQVGKGVTDALAALKITHPDLTITPVFDFVKPIDENYEGSMFSLYEGAFLAVVVVFLFLRDWRTTFISAIALPLSVIPAFIGMHYFGFSLNVITLLALSLVVGILVDDAIVEVENIVRHLRMGKTPYEAAMEAADEIGLAVIATTFTLVAVFLPTAFMTGIAGKFFKQFGWTASLAIMASLLVARVLTPMMAAYMLKPLVAGEEKDGPITRWYLKTAAWCLEYRWWTMLGTALFFAGSIALVPLLPTGFIPAEDSSQTQVKLELPPGTALTTTIAAAEQARQLVAKVPYVQAVYTTIGGGSAGNDAFSGAGFSEVRKATLTLILAPRNQRNIRKQAIETQIREVMSQIAGVRSTVGLSGSGEKYVLVLASDDPMALSTAAAAVEKDLRTISGLGAVTSSASLVRPEIIMRPNKARAGELGVSTNTMGDTLRIATSGDYDFTLSKLNLAQRQIPIVVKLTDETRQDLSALSRLTVPSSKPNTPPVMLAQVADFTIGSSTAEINRYDRSRNINFDIELSDMPLGDAKAAISQLPSLINLPEQVTQREVGDAEAQSELFASFGLAMLTGVLCIYLVLILLFKDFLQPVTILLALPLSLGGAFIALLAANKSFSMPSLIGLIMLMGIATKNSILLVEYAITAQRDHGMSRWEALIDACHKRARPIVMTTLAMGAGMLPIAMSWGKADGSFKSPMATAVIGGLITSTILSLLVIPVAFSLIDDFQIWLKKILRRRSNTV